MLLAEAGVQRAFTSHSSSHVTVDVGGVTVELLLRRSQIRLLQAQVRLLAGTPVTAALEVELLRLSADCQHYFFTVDAGEVWMTAVCEATDAGDVGRFVEDLLDSAALFEEQLQASFGASVPLLRTAG